MPKNENTLQITGKSTLEKPLEIEREYKITLIGTCNKKSTYSNEDGTFEEKFNVKQNYVELAEPGAMIPIKAQSNRSRSKAMYNAWYHIWELEEDEQYSKMPFPEFYDHVMAVTNSRLEDVWEVIKNNFIK